MHIIDYIKKYKLRVIDFASKMRVTTFSVYRWCEGKIPRDSQKEKIKELSDGEITEDDWGLYNPGQSKTPKRKAGSGDARSARGSSVEGNKNGKAKVRDGANPREKETSKGLRLHEGND